MKTHKFRMTIPPSVNSIWHRGKNGNFLNPKYRTWIDLNQAIVEEQMGKYPPISLCHIHIQVFGGKGLRKGRDISNMEKAIGDLLVRACVIVDDHYDVLQKNIQEYMGKAEESGPAYCDVLVHELSEDQRKV